MTTPRGLAPARTAKGRLQRELLKRLDVHERDGTLPTSARFLFYELGAARRRVENRHRAPAAPRPAMAPRTARRPRPRRKPSRRSSPGPNRATAPKAPTTSAAADDVELRLRALEEQVAALVTQLAAVKVKAKKKPEAGRKKKR
jgi:hypothetical protein